MFQVLYIYVPSHGFGEFSTISNVLVDGVDVDSTCRIHRNLTIETTVSPPHNSSSIQQQQARSKQGTHKTTTAPTRHPLLFGRQRTTTAAAPQRGSVNGSPTTRPRPIRERGARCGSCLLGESLCLGNPAPPHNSGSVQQQGARKQRTTTAPTRHPLPVRRRTTTPAAAAQRGSIVRCPTARPRPIRERGTRCGSCPSGEPLSLGYPAPPHRFSMLDDYHATGMI